MEPLLETFQELKISSANKTGLVYNEQMLLHSPAPKKHYENPSRLESILSHLTATSLLNHPKLSFVQHVNPALDSPILACHSEHYVEFVSEMFPPESEKKSIFIFDSYFNRHTNTAARTAVSCVMLCVDKVMMGEWANAFALVRPPGHHSGHHSTISGFCVFNNLAIGVKYAQRVYGAKKVLIFDWDIHHGDGTEHIFYSDNTVLFASVHRYENGTFYPNHGSSERIGSEQGKFFNINLGWNTTKDESVYTDDYIYVFERVFFPIFAEFKPDLVFVSAGFDSCQGDPLGDIDLTPDGYAYMLRRLQELANGRVILVLEGGYNTKSISKCSEAVLRVLLGEAEENNFREQIKPSQVSLLAAETAMKYHLEKWGMILNSKDLGSYQEDMEIVSYLCFDRQKNLIIKGEKFLKKALEAEKSFYQSEMAKQLSWIVSEFKGIEKINGIDYLHLENIFHSNWGRSSFLEVKLGEKSCLEGDKNCRSTAPKLGFRITNCLLVQPKSWKSKKGDSYIVFNDPEKSEKALVDFLLSRDGDKEEIVGFFSEKIERLIDFYQKNIENVSFVSSSLIFLINHEKKSKNLRLVDFGLIQMNSLVQKEKALKGLENLIIYLKRF